MRVREVAKIIFEEMAQKLGLEKYEFNFPPHAFWDIVFSKDFQAAIGYEKKESNFQVWHYSFKPNFKPDDFSRVIYNDYPILKITGKPFSSSLEAYRQDQNIVEYEKIKIEFRHMLKLDNPIIPLLVEIAKIAYLFNKDPSEIKYWKVFKNPDADYGI